MSENPTLQGEIIRLQVQMENVSKELHNLRNDVQRSQGPDLIATRTRLEAFAKKLDEIAEDVKTSQKTPWALYLMCASVVLAAFGLIGGYYSSNLNAKIDMKLNEQVFLEWRTAEEKRGAEQDAQLKALWARVPPAAR